MKVFTKSLKEALGIILSCVILLSLVSLGFTYNIIFYLILLLILSSVIILSILFWYNSDIFLSYYDKSKLRFIILFLKEAGVSLTKTYNTVHPFLHGYSTKHLKNTVLRMYNRNNPIFSFNYIIRISFTSKRYLFYILTANSNTKTKESQKIESLLKKYSSYVIDTYEYHKLAPYYQNFKLKFEYSDNISVPHILLSYKTLGVFPGRETKLYHKAFKKISRTIIRENKTYTDIYKIAYQSIKASKYNQYLSSNINTLHSSYKALLKAELLNHFICNTYTFTKTKLINIIYRQINLLRKSDIELIYQDKKTLNKIAILINESAYDKEDYIEMLVDYIQSGSNKYSLDHDSYLYQLAGLLEIKDSKIEQIKKEHSKPKTTFEYNKLEQKKATSSDIKYKRLFAELIINFYIDRYQVNDINLYTFVRKMVSPISKHDVLSFSQKNRSLKDICSSINKTNYKKQKFIKVLFDIAASDNVFSDLEDEYIFKAAEYLNLDRSMINLIRDQYIKRGVRQKKIKRPSSNYKSASSASSVYTFYSSKAYKVLGLNSTASADEIKKAYRALAMKFHPDKFASKGKKAMDEAEDKFQEIKEAYELIKRLKKFK